MTEIPKCLHIQVGKERKAGERKEGRKDGKREKGRKKENTLLIEAGADPAYLKFRLFIIN